jgi:hypothetical protein
MTEHIEHEPINIYVNPDSLNKTINLKLREAVPKDEVWIVNEKRADEFEQKRAKFPGLLNLANPKAMRLFLKTKYQRKQTGGKDEKSNETDKTKADS